METGKRLYFDDAISYIDKSKFVDYPVVKLRNFDQPSERPLNKIMIGLYLVVVSSGIVYLFM